MDRFLIHEGYGPLIASPSEQIGALKSGNLGPFSERIVALK
jgi:hypothetical protein